MERYARQFKHCQATVVDFYTDKGGFTIFYSYTCPKIVVFPDGSKFKFSFENSRKDWSITSSKTTSKQCNKRLGYNHRELPTMSLKDFEDQYFCTTLDHYY